MRPGPETNTTAGVDTTDAGGLGNLTQDGQSPWQTMAALLLATAKVLINYPKVGF